MFQTPLGYVPRNSDKLEHASIPTETAWGRAFYSCGLACGIWFNVTLIVVEPPLQTRLIFGLPGNRRRACGLTDPFVFRCGSFFMPSPRSCAFPAAHQTEQSCLPQTLVSHQCCRNGTSIQCMRVFVPLPPSNPPSIPLKNQLTTESTEPVFVLKVQCTQQHVRGMRSLPCEPVIHPCTNCGPCQWNGL